MHNQLIAISLTSIFTLSLGIVVYLKQRKSLPNRLYAIYSLTMFFWCFSYLNMITATNHSDGFFWSRSLHYAAILIPMLFLHFTCAWLNIIKQKKHILLAGYLFCLAFISLVYSKLFIQDAQPFYYFKYFIVGGPLHILFAVYFFGLVIYTEYLLYKRMKIEQGIYAVQIKYIFFGYIFGYLGGLSAFLPAYSIKPLIFGLYPIPIGMVLVTYAILKYNLLDIRIVISRTLIFLLIYIPILSIPFVIIFTNYQYILNTFGKHYWIIPTIAEFVLTLIGLLAYRYIQKKAERKILQDEYQHERAIKQLTKELITIETKEALIQKVIHQSLKKWSPPKENTAVV